MKKFRIIKSRDKGLFSNFLQVIQSLYLSDLDGRIPIVDWDIFWYSQDDPYNGSNNVWEYYFEPVSSYRIEDVDFDTDDVVVASKYRKKGKNIPNWDKKCWDWKSKPPRNCLNNPSGKCRNFVNNIISKHIKIKMPIMHKINNFYDDNLKDFNVLAVHIRCCNDLKKGIRDISLEQYIKVLEEHLSKNKNSRIFIATDYNPIINKFHDIFKEKLFYYDSHRSEDGFAAVCGYSDPKERKRGGALMGEEVLIDTILLSKCNKLIHGTSNVSSSAMYFNKNIEHIYI